MSFSDSQIESLISRFEMRQLPKTEWTHEAHLIVAIWYCSKHSLVEALDLVRANITNHNTAVGTPNSDQEGYHESITKFWLLIAKDFIKDRHIESMSDLCNAFIASPQGKSAYPLEYYSAELLFSMPARHRWIEPDLKELS
jgi:hypothetical protein